jgi:hypothetical protein
MNKEIEINTRIEINEEIEFIEYLFESIYINPKHIVEISRNTGIKIPEEDKDFFERKTGYVFIFKVETVNGTIHSSITHGDCDECNNSRSRLVKIVHSYSKGV